MISVIALQRKLDARVVPVQIRALIFWMADANRIRLSIDAED